MNSTVNTTTTQQGGGKGGGGVTQVDAKYSYSAAAMLAIGHGPIVGIASAWKDKRRYAGSTVPGRISKRIETYIVPNTGGTFNVPLYSEAFAGNGGVTTPGPYGPYDTGPVDGTSVGQGEADL